MSYFPVWYVLSHPPDDNFRDICLLKDLFPCLIVNLFVHETPTDLRHGLFDSSFFFHSVFIFLIVISFIRPLERSRTNKRQFSFPHHYTISCFPRLVFSGHLRKTFPSKCSNLNWCEYQPSIYFEMDCAFDFPHRRKKSKETWKVTHRFTPGGVGGGGLVRWLIQIFGGASVQARCVEQLKQSVPDGKFTRFAFDARN